MDKNYFSSDRYANSHDNFLWTVSQFVDSRQNPKNILSADSSSLRLTDVPSLTAFTKTTYNKIRRRFRPQFTATQAQTATQNIIRQILHYFFERFLSVRLAHLRARSCARKRAILPPSKTRAKKSETPLLLKRVFKILFCLSFSFFTSTHLYPQSI